MVKHLFNDIKYNLSQNKNGLSENDILRKYLGYPCIGNDTLARDE